MARAAGSGEKIFENLQIVPNILARIVYELFRVGVNFQKRENFAMQDRALMAS